MLLELINPVHIFQMSPLQGPFSHCRPIIFKAQQDTQKKN